MKRGCLVSLWLFAQYHGVVPSVLQNFAGEFVN